MFWNHYLTGLRFVLYLVFLNIYFQNDLTDFETNFYSVLLPKKTNKDGKTWKFKVVQIFCPQCRWICLLRQVYNFFMIRNVDFFFRRYQSKATTAKLCTGERKPEWVLGTTTAQLPTFAGRWFCARTTK